MPMAFKQQLERLAKEKAPGPLPSFSTFHALIAIELIAEESLGRSKIAEELGIGEGAARTLINRLRDAGFVATSKSGCTLTDKGLRLWKEFRSKVKTVRIERNELTFTDHSYAVLIRNGAQRVKTGMEQRDAAVVSGAKSATTMLFKKGLLVFPSFSQNIGKDFPKASTQITSLLKPQENDAIIVVSSEDLVKAEYAALAAAWTLLDND
jgi:DNA-binding MarR family transcriptional regulator